MNCDVFVFYSSYKVEFSLLHFVPCYCFSFSKKDSTLSHNSSRLSRILLIFLIEFYADQKGLVWFTSETVSLFRSFCSFKSVSNGTHDTLFSSY